MKKIWIATCVAVVTSAVLIRADDDLPKRFNFDRYQGMLNRSPFAVASAVALPAATPDFAKGLYVANAAKTPDGDLVTVMSSDDKNLKEYLTTTGPNEHGYSISNVEWSDRPGGTKVTISKDGKYATLTFNQALISAPAGPSAGQPPPPPIPAAGALPGIPRPPIRVPPGPNATPHTRGVIQRNPSATQQQQQPLPEE
jgi:hypothetical protein